LKGGVVMKKSGNGFLYLFIFTTLFLLLFVKPVCAITAQDILSNYEIYQYQTEAKKEDGVTPLDSYEVIKLSNQKNDFLFDEDTGVPKLSEDTYFSLRITYQKDGEYVASDLQFGTDEEGNVIFKLPQQIPEGTEYYLSVVESKEGVDENGEIGTTDTVTSTDPMTFQLTSSEAITEPKGTTFFSAIWSGLTKDLSKIGKILIETLCDILVPVGDSFLDMICNSIGEVVTLDGVVYNKVSKLDIDFFTNANMDVNNEEMKLDSPLKSIMGNVVNKLYVFFRNFVIVFYLVMLVYIGLKIILTSTAERKANYKSILMAWVMGVAMLVFFPYVMKYAIKLNSALCQMIGEQQMKEPRKIEGLANKLYGKDEFVSHMLLSGETLENGNAMLNVRYYGAKNWNLPLLIVYFIFIGQLIAILIMYYKRVFMIGFLISIFPIVVAIYPLNKIGDIRMNPFGQWLKEFLVNVFVQSFHAATYRVIVKIGVDAYANSNNWLFLIISVLFLFEGEKLIRAIFNAKSSANTIGDMAVAGAFAMKMMKNVGSVIPSLDKNKEEEAAGAAQDKARRDAATSTQTPGATANRNAVNAISSAPGGTALPTVTPVPTGTNSGSSISTTNTSTNHANTTNNSNAGASGSGTTQSNATGTASVDQKINNAQGGKFAKPIAGMMGTGFSIGSQLTGGIVGATYGLAQNNAKQPYSAAVASFASGLKTGKAVGASGKGFLANRVDKAGAKRTAAMVAAAYEAGEYDDEIGINEADRQLRTERANAIRKAYADYARRSVGIRGKAAAQLSFYKAQMKILNESVERDRH